MTICSTTYLNIFSLSYTRRTFKRKLNKEFKRVRSEKQIRIERLEVSFAFESIALTLHPLFTDTRNCFSSSASTSAATLSLLPLVHHRSVASSQPIAFRANNLLKNQSKRKSSLKKKRGDKNKTNGRSENLKQGEENRIEGKGKGKKSSRVKRGERGEGGA